MSSSSEDTIDQNSAFISHVTSYPVVSDSISAFKSTTYGQKSIQVADAVNVKLVKPVLSYGQKPYGYIHPYVAKADELAESGLSKIDEKFPIITKDAETIKGTVVGYAYAPFAVAGKTKRYVIGTYDSEWKKCGGPGYFPAAKAVITTSLLITGETLDWLSGVIHGAKKEGQHIVQEHSS